MTQHRHPTRNVVRLLDDLPAPLALFDEAGSLLDANASFGVLLGDRSAKAPTFRALFGADMTACEGGCDVSLALDGRHLAVSAKRVDGCGWLVTLQDVTAWVERSAEAAGHAERDVLTDMPNRAFMLPELARRLEEPAGGAAFLMIDLDRFKAVNDTLGHAMGDALLCKVADRMKGALRSTDRVARLGGDEFAILQVGAEQPVGAETLARRLVELISRPYVIDGHMIDIGASIGIAFLGEGLDAETVMKQADIALYRAKGDGRGRYTFFEPAMDEAMQRRRAMEIDLRRALALRQFELHYQPQMEVSTKAITGMEALIRWRHPVRGLVPPADFIPLAEETGLITPIGEWVIRQACDDAARWPEDVAVAVNVSAKQLSSKNLVPAVLGALSHAGLSPSRLEVEITESVLMSDLPHCVETLHALRALGVRISMDDFGTGYSSLSYLSSFPFDKVKIDQSFVRSGDPEKNGSIVRAIAAIGEQFGMTTIAEGVETEGQLGSVSDNGCQSVQGFLVGRPVPAGEIPALLARLTPAAPAPATQDSPASADADLHRLVYYSRNAVLGLESEVRASVEQILEASQRNNARVRVTGALMFTDGYFAQVLEGPRSEVERTFERIQMDERHFDIQLLSFEAVASRAFAGWAMAFVGASEEGAARFGHVAGESGFDFAAIDGDQLFVHVRELLRDEERRAPKADTVHLLPERSAPVVARDAAEGEWPIALRA